MHKIYSVFFCFQEILSRGILLPLINQLSDPDYINQYVIWMVRFIIFKMNNISRIFLFKALSVFPVIRADRYLVGELPMDVLAEMVNLWLLY